MKQAAKCMIFCIVVSMVLASNSVGQVLPMESLLPAECNIVVSLNGVDKALQSFENSKFMAIVEEFHKDEHPDLPSPKTKLQEFKGKEAFFQLVREKVVLGIVAKKKGETPHLVLIGKGNEEYLQKFIEEEQRKQKMHRLADQEYKGSKVTVVLQPEKGKLETRYIVSAGSYFLFSNDMETLKACYDRATGSAQGGWQPSEMYAKMGEGSLVKVYIDVAKILPQLESDLGKKAPIEKKFPGVAQFFDAARARIKETRCLAACAKAGEAGIQIELFRERVSGSPELLPSIAFPSKLIDEKTLAFVAVPVPYTMLWYGMKDKGMKRDPRHWRSVESRASELFDWMSVEDDIVPGIGPHTFALLRNPAELKGPLAVPSLSLFTTFSSNIPVDKALEKIYSFASKDPKFGKDAKISISREKDGLKVNVRPTKAPFDKLLEPSGIFGAKKMVLGTHAEIVRNVFSALDLPGDTKVQMGVYFNFKAWSALIQANLPFFKKEAEKKGHPFPEDKVKKALTLLDHFSELRLYVAGQGDATEVWEFSLK